MGLKLQRANINLVENRLILAPEWGSITGDITEQEDLNLILTSVNSELETLDNSLNTTNTNLANLEQTTEGINNRLSGVEQTYATKSELNQLSTDLDNLTDSALTEQDADNKYALKNGSISEDFKAKSLYIAPYTISVEGGELSFFHNGGRTNIHLPEDMGSGTVALTKNYYDKTEIDNKLSNLDLSIFEIVNELPTTNINENKIYLVRNDQTTGSNLYTEYRYTNNSWEVLGEYKSDVDLADYYTKDETDTLLANKADTADVYNKAEVDALIASGSSDLFIVTYTAENNTIDKTIAEINTARDDGKILIIKYVRTVYSDDYPRGVLYGYLQYNHNDYYYGDIRYLSTLYSIHINSGGGIDLQKTDLPNYNTTELTNYYTKTQTYNKTEIDALVSGGGSDVFIVTVTRLANYTYAKDKTYAEILEAYNSGKVLVLKLNKYNTYYNYSGYIYYLEGQNRFTARIIDNDTGIIDVEIYNTDAINVTRNIALADKSTSSLTNYYTKSNTYSKSEIDTKIGDIESILATL